MEVTKAVVLLCALQNLLFQYIFFKMRDEVLFSCSWDFQKPLKFSESSEIFSFLQNSEILKFAEGNTELLP